MCIGCCKTHNCRKRRHHWKKCTVVCGTIADWKTAWVLSWRNLLEVHRGTWNWKQGTYSMYNGSVRIYKSNDKLTICGTLSAVNRFGKVLWTSDGRRSVSDEVLGERHKIRDLEKGGNVSVEDVLGGNDTRWCFQTM